MPDENAVESPQVPAVQKAMRTAAILGIIFTFVHVTIHLFVVSINVGPLAMTIILLYALKRQAGTSSGTEASPATLQETEESSTDTPA